MMPHLDRPVMLPVLNAILALLAGVALTMHGADSLDPAFAPGLATLKQATGFSEQSGGQSSTDWQPNLHLLVGVKAVEKSRRTVYFVELTTLPPPPTNSLGEPWQPVRRTNDWAWSPSNRSQFVTMLYPVRVRVFDESGRKLKEGQTPMSWGMLTNGLLDMCRLSLEFFPPENRTDPPVATSVAARKLSDVQNNELMRTVGGGFLWMMGMFGDLQTVPAVENVWEKAQCAIRIPGLWTMVTAVFKGFSVSLEPRLSDVTLTNVGSAGPPGPEYRLPLDLRGGKQNLTQIEIVVGPAHGAEMLLAGIRSIRAVHPTKPQHEFLAQVIAAGAGRDEK
jgi:hypothetical protein